MYIRMLQELDEIKYLRKKFNLTQLKLAKLSGVSQSMIAKIEAGRLEPTFSNAKKIFTVLNSLTEEKDLIAKDFIKNKIISVNSTTKLKEVIKKMKSYNISQLPVINSGVLVGLISESIILENLFSNKTAILVEDVMCDPPPSVSVNTSIRIISNLLKSFQMVVINKKGKLLGVITKSDLIQKMYD